ncbi:hypothetical protein [Amycolatopsis jiangsuensis]|uniref:Ig-like domain-containing protein n=1 Tax=Amycolatopsis jiangsuensis TaxID=1181879 RepID=A0A840IPC8_9PSEU|nr:hypothetical protein [Amycolatopsis jiangsuensis]MBB4683305.1 hypothetical protein [Amycolatopsis jiangsuensis]
MRRTITTAMATMALGLGFAPVARAEESPALRVYPDSLRPGAVFGTGISGGCDTYSDVTSPGFAAPVSLVAVGGDRNNLWGNGAASSTPGEYMATATCDGTTLRTTFTVQPHPAPAWWLNPVEVEPGGEISAGSDTITGCPGGPTGPVTSPGFAAPLQFTEGGNFGRFSGHTTAGSVPGTYTATLRCASTPVVGTIEFTILGTPPGNGTLPAKHPSPTHQRTSVVPVGAPETGGGSTAGR